MTSGLNIQDFKPFSEEYYPKTYKWCTEFITSKFKKLPDWVNREKFYQTQRDDLFRQITSSLENGFFNIDTLHLSIPLCCDEINYGDIRGKLFIKEDECFPKRVIVEILRENDVCPQKIEEMVERWNQHGDTQSEYEDEDEDDKTKPIPLKKRLMYIKKLLKTYPRVLCYQQAEGDSDYFGKDAPEPKCPEIVKIPVKSILQEDDDAYDDPKFYEDDDKHNLLEFWKMEQIEENKFDCEVYLHSSSCECDFIYPDIYLTDEGKWIMDIQGGEVLFELI